MSHLLGIDIGTTGARAVVVDTANGVVVSQGTAEYPLHTPRPLWAEQDADDWWRGAQAAVGKALASLRLLATPDVVAVGLSGQMHGVVLVDGDGRPTGRSLIWCDGRSHEECVEITSRIGAARLIELTANPALVGFSAPKLLWVRKHEPRQYDRARKFLLPKDYIRYRLTGEYATEVSDASGTLLFDVAGRRWSRDVLSLLDISPDLLPSVHESPAVTGVLSASVAGALGLPAGIPVVGGGGDQAAGAVGNGIVSSGVVSATLGTSGVVFAHSDAPTRDPRGRVHTMCHAVPGKWCVFGCMLSAGGSFQWFRNQPGADEVAHAKKKEVDPY